MTRRTKVNAGAQDSERDWPHLLFQAYPRVRRAWIAHTGIRWPGVDWVHWCRSLGRRGAIERGFVYELEVRLTRIRLEASQASGKTRPEDLYDCSDCEIYVRKLAFPRRKRWAQVSGEGRMPWFHAYRSARVSFRRAQALLAADIHELRERLAAPIASLAHARNRLRPGSLYAYAPQVGSDALQVGSDALLAGYLMGRHAAEQERARGKSP